MNIETFDYLPSQFRLCFRSTPPSRPNKVGLIYLFLSEQFYADCQVCHRELTSIAVY